MGKSALKALLVLAMTLTCGGTHAALSQHAAVTPHPLNSRPEGPCDVYAAAGDACVAAYSTTRAMYAAYDGPLYQVLRQSDGKTLDVGVVRPVTTKAHDAGGYADMDAQDSFRTNTYCWISVLYDQSPKHNALNQAPRGGWSGPAMGGFDNLPLADMAPVMVMGHKGLRCLSGARHGPAQQ